MSTKVIRIQNMVMKKFDLGMFGLISSRRALFKISL